MQVDEKRIQEIVDKVLLRLSPRRASRALEPPRRGLVRLCRLTFVVVDRASGAMPASLAAVMGCFRTLMQR